MSFSESEHWKKMLSSIIYLKALCSYCLSSFISFTLFFTSLSKCLLCLPANSPRLFASLSFFVRLSWSFSPTQTFMWRGCSVYQATAWDRQPWGRCWMLELSWISKRVISTPMTQLQYSRPTWESCQNLCSHTGTIMLTWRLEVVLDINTHPSYSHMIKFTF